MADASFDVIFSGKLQAGAEPAQVRAKLARLFKTEPEKLGHLFTGQRVPIKRGVDTATALQYQAALAQAGAIVDLVDTGAPADAEVTTIAAAPPPREAPRAAPVTVPPAIAARSAPPSAPAYSIADPGALLVEPMAVATADIDTQHLTVAAAGELLVEPQTVAAPDYDLSALSLDPPGTPLSDSKPVPPPHYDLSALSLDA